VNGGGSDAAEVEPHVIDEVTGLANRRGFMEILRHEQSRQSRYGGSSTLLLIDVDQALSQVPAEQRPEVLIEIAGTLVDATRDTDTLARVDDHRFGLLGIYAGGSTTPIVGRLRLFLEMRGVPAEVKVAEPGNLESAWRALEGEGSDRPSLRLVR
jgi:hypothetical protein